MPVSRSVQDFEKQMRAPKWIYVGPWQCDDSTGSTWCYTEGMNIRPATSILREPTELASEGGNLLLNVSPMGDGSIPEPQQKGLREVGDWLGVNGEAIYGSRPWVRMGEGPDVPDEPPGDWKGGSTPRPGPRLRAPPLAALTESDFRFTTANNNLYVIGYRQPTADALIHSLSRTKAKVERVTMLGVQSPPCKFNQSEQALAVPSRSLLLTNNSRTWCVVSLQET